MIKGKAPEEIRRTFNIKNDFTPQEVRRQRLFSLRHSRLSLSRLPRKNKSERKTNGVKRNKSSTNSQSSLEHFLLSPSYFVYLPLTFVFVFSDARKPIALHPSLSLFCSSLRSNRMKVDRPPIKNNLNEHLKIYYAYRDQAKREECIEHRPP